jgi:pimeloyl-ACP methyl ester carboxylesterase
VPDASSDRSTVVLAGRDGNRLVADVAGPVDGPAVVLLHGGGQTRHSWGTTVGALAAQGWRAFTVDLRGHGDSDWVADGDYTLDAFAGDVVAVAAAVAPASSPPALVGASLGGLSALTALGEHRGHGPVGRALVLVDVAPRMEAVGRDRIAAFMLEHLDDGFASLDAVADAIAAYNPHRPRPTDLSGLRKNLRERDGRWYWHWDPRFMRGRLGGPDETRSSLVDEGRLQRAARAVAEPTLLVRGRVSDLLSEQGARELLELVPHARLVDVAGAGHMVAGDRNDLFNDAVVGFLEQVRAG